MSMGLTMDWDGGRVRVFLWGVYKCRSGVMGCVFLWGVGGGVQCYNGVLRSGPVFQ